MEDNELIRAYVAGAIDSGSTISALVKHDEEYSVGYTISPLIEVRRHRPELPDLLSYWGQNIGIHSELKSIDEEFRWTVMSRQGVNEILNKISPYLMVYHDAAEIMQQELLPRLEDGRHTSEKGFVETMGYVDSLRDATIRKSRSQYTKEFFEELWADKL